MCCTQTTLIFGARRNTLCGTTTSTWVYIRSTSSIPLYLCIYYIYVLPLVLVVMGTSKDLPLDEMIPWNEFVQELIRMYFILLHVQCVRSCKALAV